MVHSCIPLEVRVVHSCVLLLVAYFYDSRGPLCHFTVRGRVNVCVFVVIIVIDLITIFDIFPIRVKVGGIFRVILGSVLIIEEWVPESVSDVKALWVAACKVMQAIDYILLKGERSEALSVQSLSDGKAHE